MSAHLDLRNLGVFPSPVSWLNRGDPSAIADGDISNESGHRPSLSLTPVLAKRSFEASFVAMGRHPLHSAQVRGGRSTLLASLASGREPCQSGRCFSASAAPSVRPRSDRQATGD